MNDQLVILPTPSRSDPGRGLHVLTLTPFYPTDSDDVDGCFVFEPLAWTSKLGIHNTVLAIQPFYRRGELRSDRLLLPAHWIRYFSIPGGIGLPSAGAFVFARIVGRIREMQRMRAVDLIHAHGALPCGHAAMLLSRELKIPFVVSVHGLDAYSTVQVIGQSGEWCRRISRRVFVSSRRVVCVSERVREEVLEGTGKNCRTSVVYNGVDTDLFSPGTELNREPLTILSVGNLISIKGHDLLVRAVSSLSDDFPGLILNIIGSGPELGKLQRLAAELGCAGRVRFLGRCSRRETAIAMRHCTLFALPSRYEGLGCVYLEAMSSGKVAIGCREQGIAEVIQHGRNGFLVGPENERELTVALSILLRDESQRKRMGSVARDTIVHGFTLAQQADKFIRVYRECAT